jgi:hypothetical protein
MLLGRWLHEKYRLGAHCLQCVDIVDYNEPTMLIVGSRGLGQLKGYDIRSYILIPPT